MRLRHPEHGDVVADHPSTIGGLKAYGYREVIETPTPEPEPEPEPVVVEPEEFHEDYEPVDDEA